MSCTTCIKVNNIPGCLGDDTETVQLTGLTFPDHPGENLIARIRNMATGRVNFVVVTTDGDGVVTSLDIFDSYPLGGFAYEIRFLDSSNVPANFVLTNPDDSTEEGCCIEFTPNRNQTIGESWALTSQECSV